jgi:muramoyltetrapeptide carboxypeptidase
VISVASPSSWIAPPRLVAGDRVALVAPASPFRREEFEAGLAELRRLGFDPYYDERVFARHGYVAGLPAVRAAVLMDAWREPSVRAIVAVRGGYGSAQLLPLLDPGLLRQHPKAFIGYSDMTTLLAWYLQQGVVAFHGPMVEGRLARGPAGYHAPSLLGSLMQAAPLGPLAPEGLEVFSPGEATGVLCGGTVTQLAASLGTPWAFTPPDGAILFLEDVGERPYRIDRLLTQLHQAGVLRRAGGLVLGEFRGCDEPDGRVRGRDVLRALLHGFPGPVVAGFPSGHTTGPGWTLPFGVAARLVTAPVPALHIDAPAVS